jgi:capsular exopolysaccharide synthesis family protein
MKIDKPEPERPSPRENGEVKSYQLQRRYPPSTYLSHVTDHDQVQFRRVWNKLSRRKWLVMIIVILITSPVVVWMCRAKSIYRASTIIEVGKDGSSFVKTGEQSSAKEGTDPLYMVDIKTKMLMITSRSLLEDVVVELKLDKDPKFLRGVPKRPIQGLFDAAHNERLARQNKSGRPEAESLRLAPFVDEVERNLSVQHIRDTKGIKLSFTHTDPVLASDVVNGAARRFIESDFTGKLERYTNYTTWLERSLQELKAKAEQAEQALANYTREHNILSTEGKSTLTAERLSALHDQFTRAQIDRMLKQSLYTEVQQGRVTELPEAYADLLYKSSSNSKVAALQKELGDLETKAAQFSVHYGSENPSVLEIHQQIAAVRKQLEASSQSMEAKLKLDYERALRDEQSLQVALERGKAQAVKENQATILHNILKQDVETAKSLYTEFLIKSNQARVQVAEQYTNLRVIDEAKTPPNPVGPNRILTVLIGLIVSLLASFGLVLFLDYLDDSIKSVDDVLQHVQLPVLGRIPTADDKHLHLSPGGRDAAHELAGQSPARLPEGDEGGQPAKRRSHRRDPSIVLGEAYRTLRTSVLHSSRGGSPRVILVTSSQPGEGKTTTTVNTALSLANLGEKVLIIDADLRKPGIHKLFGMKAEPGLSTYLQFQVDVDKLIKPVQDVPNLSVLTCGVVPSNPAEIISSEKMRDMLEALADRYNYIVIDSPPIMNVTDPAILSTLVDGVLLVIQAGRTSRDLVSAARHELSNVGARILGVVLNQVDFKQEGPDQYVETPQYSNYRRAVTLDEP